MIQIPTIQNAVITTNQLPGYTYINKVEYSCSSGHQRKDGISTWTVDCDANGFTWPEEQIINCSSKYSISFSMANLGTCQIVLGVTHEDIGRS